MTATTTRKRLTICGFCADGNHARCPHAIENGKVHGLWFCNCAEPNCGGKILSCIHCKKVHDDVTPDTRQCVDRDACAARIQVRRDNDPNYQNIITIIEENKVAKVAEKAVKAEKAAKTGICKCGCEGTTKGGNFLPGHDARFVSEQVGHVTGKNKTEAVARKEVLAVSESLAAKFDKSLGLAKAKAEKAKKAEADKAAATKAKAEEKKAKAEKAKADKAAKAAADDE